MFSGIILAPMPFTALGLMRIGMEDNEV